MYIFFPFQFTHPGKGATTASLPASIPARFQFTHPGKGATRASATLAPSTPVSIHAPWEGCDAIKRLTRADAAEFQFTHPGKGATYTLVGDLPLGLVSIHAPWEGCDAVCVDVVLCVVVSIHAPWEGCDLITPKISSEGTRVSIHAPWEGCDLLASCPLRSPLLSFNSRTLGRVRQQASDSAVRYLEFQFTHPGKGATKTQHTDSRALRVSIHAPWEGCDATKTGAEWELFKFQFTHPGKGATRHDHGHNAGYSFQFTHPGKGATQPRRHRPLGADGFNSRTLGRVRLAVATEGWSVWEFQFTHPGKGATRNL